jgi:hypothetical protein
MFTRVGKASFLSKANKDLKSSSSRFMRYNQVSAISSLYKNSRLGVPAVINSDGGYEGLVDLGFVSTVE